MRLTRTYSTYIFDIHPSIAAATSIVSIPTDRRRFALWGPPRPVSRRDHIGHPFRIDTLRQKLPTYPYGSDEPRGIDYTRTPRSRRHH